MRELRASVRAGKPIVTVRETQANKGAMSDEEVAAGAGVLEKNATLQTLDLESNQVGDAGAASLASALEKNATCTVEGV